MHPWRRSFLASALIILQIGLLFADQRRPAFFILTPSGNINDVTARLEAQGAHIASRVPPSIVVANIPLGFNLKNLPGVKSMYESAVPLSMLQPMGVIATAAGMQWNRSFLSRAAGANATSFASARSLVSQKSLMAPMELSLSQDNSLVVIAWKAVSSALFYEVQAATDSGFRDITFDGNVAGLTLNAPAPEGNGPVDMFYRVRAIDHGDDEHLRENDVFGPWSNVADLRVQSTPSATPLIAPTLTTPADKHHYEGFTVILEWNSSGALRYRAQVANDKDFKNILFDAVVKERKFACSSPAMELGSTLYWRVKAWDDQKSAWSEVREFTIDSPAFAKTDVFTNPEAPK
jgi:hypothetical protein